MPLKKSRASDGRGKKEKETDMTTTNATSTAELPVIANAVAITYKALGQHEDASDNAAGYVAREDLHALDDGIDWDGCEEGEIPEMLSGWTAVKIEGGERYAVRDDDIYAIVRYNDGHRGWYTAYPLGGETSCSKPEAVTDSGVLVIQQCW